MHRLIAIVLPEPVAILKREALALGLAGLDRACPCSANSSRSRNDADALDLGQVDERLDGLALAEVEAERAPVVGPVLVVEPEAEQALAWSALAPG